jgi:hypothetical protein
LHFVYHTPLITYDVFGMLLLVLYSFLACAGTLVVGFQRADEGEFGVVHLYPAPSDSEPEPNCTTDTAIIDKLLNGTGYNKFKIPSKGFFCLRDKLYFQNNTAWTFR